MQVGHRTDRGRERPSNEDAYLVLLSQPWRLLAVADGMGGHVGGEVASTVAVETLRQAIESDAETGALPPVEQAENYFTTLLDRTNNRVWELSQNSGLQGMGTTLSALFLRGLQGLVGHIGDSRIYLIRKGQIELISRDHSLVEEMVQNGQLPESEAASHPQKHILTRALGTQEQVQFDIFPFFFQQKDIVLLCSDGLSNMLSADEMLNLAWGAPDMQAAADLLVDTANGKGGSDNITVVLAQFEAGDGVL